LLGINDIRRTKTWLDEVYRLVERHPEIALPQVAEIYERGLSLGVMSKAYGLSALRIEWIACKDRVLVRLVGRVKHYTSICNAAPSELLAEIALKARDRILRLLSCSRRWILGQWTATFSGLGPSCLRFRDCSSVFALTACQSLLPTDRSRNQLAVSSRSI
jgi:hypothetical protein